MHTPGPWKWEGEALKAKDQIILWPSNVISDPETPREILGSCGRKCEKPEVAQANMDLIAAAPVLLRACEQVLVASEDGGTMTDIDWERLRASVNLARGRLRI